ncbi:19429_t:CDS:2, partial [Racocetra persica]
MEIESSKSAQPDISHEREVPKELELDVYIGLHNGYPITQIDCSPKMKYVATLSEFDKSVALWSIDPNQQSLRYENIILIKNIDVGSETLTTFTVSDDGGSLVMVSIIEHKAYILVPEKTNDGVKWIFQSSIELKNFDTSDKVYITPKGKLIFFKKMTYEITIWNLETLSVESQILLDWNCNFEPIQIGLSDDEELLGLGIAANAANSSTLTYCHYK